ncbi:MAG: sigma-54 dependent transcriptional regulator [Thermodesulfovibrio sp.]|uniref:sigma-54-dependent transcriptional regulator n=1 Tax=unclassified Thermodesulfovibrio TaxID=2645936 RepID=UPI00083B4595|nr:MULTISPECIES: sigma-54 dependent transcriptional regulator [unclassified Thermodesulfovibrio]MDI1472363.1 sigma-54 dependent transcriptional regulator [Thermodesulfovibrio sp. 1176]MDI6714228.1 sigma-54 dependent transcriptional regulator [Thermodesulfovibrio sp.]ODA43958.1 Response regulator of zinc sigma-54-dependent two-component system [Thermodesulfovibrio sp. N1]
MTTILIIDDEPLQRDILTTILSEEDYLVYSALNLEEAEKIINEFHPEIILTDLKLGMQNGMDILNNLPQEPFSPLVIVITAFGTISSAVEAIKKGAFDYLTKPIDREILLLTVKKAEERINLMKENLRLKKELYEKFKIEGIIGKSKKMLQVLDIVKKVTPTNATVLIYGESGTGKELIARAIHYNSPRKDKPFIAINCAAIPETLIESELFGYEPGAFTGANTRKIGIIESADKGTLFLDEIAELPPLTQSKLLRVLQEKEVRRIGGKDAIKVDLRIIAATNKNLSKEVEQNRFREDLYYRLKVITVEIPPLRERKDDIPELVNFFIEKYSKEFGKRVNGIEEKALQALINYPWPGNIRQLETVIERAIIICEKDKITLSDIQDELKISIPKNILDIEIPDEGINYEELEKEILKKALIKSNYIIAKAARLLGMSYKTFWYRLEKFGLSENFPKRENFPK